MDPRGEEFGEERLEALLVRIRHMSPREIVREVNLELERFVGGPPDHDDVTVVAVRKTDPTA
jgi:serine phosphatase RsbU (regulator of sigma subunit)